MRGACDAKVKLSTRFHGNHRNATTKATKLCRLSPGSCVGSCVVHVDTSFPADIHLLAFKGISLLHLLSGSPHADRARCQLANPTTQPRQGVAEAARWGFHCGREGHQGLPGPFLRAAPEPFLTDFGVRGHLARLGARLAQPPDRPHAAPAPRRGAPGVCLGAADTLSRGAGGPRPARGPVMPP